MFSCVFLLPILRFHWFIPRLPSEDEKIQVAHDEKSDTIVIKEQNQVQEINYERIAT